jgi:hypothetical protein
MDQFPPDFINKCLTSLPWYYYVGNRKTTRNSVSRYQTQGIKFTDETDSAGTINVALNFVNSDYYGALLEFDWKFGIIYNLSFWIRGNATFDVLAEY